MITTSPRPADLRAGNATLEYVILLTAVAVFVLTIVLEYGNSVQNEFSGADDNAAWDQIAANLEGGSDGEDGPCPYYYNPATGRWHDPSTHLFVSLDNATSSGCS
jgi:hypothetical protein